MKKFVAGLLIGLLVASGTIFASNSFMAQSISTKLFVNGQHFQPSPGAMSINGTTYLPLRAVGEALKVKVDFVKAKNQIEIGGAEITATQPFELTTGNYAVGVDIPRGKYNVKALSGMGNFQGKVKSQQYGSLNEILGTEMGSLTYSNLKLDLGDTINISGSVVLEFTPVK
jgi:hypothetical protein